MNERRPGFARAGETQLACWRRQPEAASFTRFNPFMFAFDKIPPGSATGQTDAWALDTRTALGLWMKRASHGLGVVGGALSLLALAGFFGIVRPD